jgi:hypothetical protein
MRKRNKASKKTPPEGAAVKAVKKYEFVLFRDSGMVLYVELPAGVDPNNAAVKEAILQYVDEHKDAKSWMEPNLWIPEANEKPRLDPRKIECKLVGEKVVPVD